MDTGFYRRVCGDGGGNSFLRVTNQDVMMSADNLNWYYLLYIFGSMSVVLGVINLWMYRKPLWQILHNDNIEDDKE